MPPHFRPMQYLETLVQHSNDKATQGLFVFSPLKIMRYLDIFQVILRVVITFSHVLSSYSLVNTT